MAYQPQDYVRPPGLEHALAGARALQQPLLLAGEPGTGKTTLADWVLHHLRAQAPEDQPFHPKVLRFQTKTTSAAQDLFYTYDALAHFQAANLQRSQKGAEDFIELQALGKAIAMSNPQPALQGKFRTELPAQPTSSVVLIDEVDKAPRDFTNDILEEINRRFFFLREQNLRVEQGDQAEIVLIMTSNSEKNLPDAFLRRCAFFHIEFPQGEKLREILQKHFDPQTDFTSQAYQELLNFFEQVRQQAPRKKPATAELLGWLHFLSVRNYFDLPQPKQRELMLHNLSFLVKTQEDLAAAKKVLEKWRQ
jgi:MoxR-like ATPase